MKQNFILKQIKKAIRTKRGTIVLDDGRNISPAEAKTSFKAIARAATRCSGGWRPCGVLLN